MPKSYIRYQRIYKTTQKNKKEKNKKEKLSVIYRLSIAGCSMSVSFYVLMSDMFILKNGLL